MLMVSAQYVLIQSGWVLDSLPVAILIQGV